MFLRRPLRLHLLSVGCSWRSVASSSIPSGTTASAATTAQPSSQLLIQSKVRPQLLRPYLEPVSPFQQDDPYGFEKLVTVERLFNARCHLGHKVGTLNENMKWALYGERLGVCIFDLDVTRKYMIRALNFLATLSYSGGRVLFICNNKSAISLVEEKAAQLGHYAQTRRWPTGIFMDPARLVGGPVRFPDAVVFLNTQTSTLNKHPGIVEAAKVCIPTIGVIDSNCEPNYLCYPIPGNDDTYDSLELYMEMFTKAIELGVNARRKTL